MKDNDEPGREDEFGYIFEGNFYGAMHNETSRFICEYSIQEACEAYEAVQKTPYTFKGDENFARVTASDEYRVRILIKHRKAYDLRILMKMPISQLNTCLTEIGQLPGWVPDPVEIGSG